MAQEYGTDANLAPASASTGPDVTSGRPRIDMRQLGSSGLKQFGGFIYESTLKELEGRRAVEVFKEMGDSDATCGVILFTIEKMVRGVKWRVAPASTESYDRDAAKYVETCLDDMNEYSWSDFVSEAFVGMLRYGYSYHEILYKRRAGKSPLPHLDSKYSDGRIGWRDIASRSQDTIYRWIYSDNGRLLGAEQQAPPHYKLTILPIEKCLLFRTSVEKGNPEGRSIFRSAYRSYYLKRGIENIEGVGVERDVAGLPIGWVPRTLLEAAESTIDTEERARAQESVAAFKEMVINIRRDAQEGILMPLEYDAEGNKLFDLTLLSSGGSRQFDTDRIIQRYDQRIAMQCLCDFLLLGQGATATGSWAMHTDKTKLFLQSITAFLRMFTEQMNKAIARLMDLNTFEMSDYPKLEFESLEQVNIAEMGDLLLKASQSGMPLWPDDELSKYIRRAAGWPEAVEDIDDMGETFPQPNEMTDDVEELIDDPDVNTQIGLPTPTTGGPVTNVLPKGRPMTNVYGQGGRAVPV